VFTKLGWQIKISQKYKCQKCNHIWRNSNINLIGMFNVEIIEQATFMYLRSLSFNSVSEIFRSWFKKDVLPKKSFTFPY